MKIPPWAFLVGGIAIAAALWLHGNWHGSKTTANSYKAQIAKANNEVLRERGVKQEQIDELVKKYFTDTDAISRERDIALDRLRDRPTRVVGTAPTDCTGTTGATLSREDAGFLTREAARGDRLRNALKVCYDYADSLQE